MKLYVFEEPRCVWACVKYVPKQSIAQHFEHERYHKFGHVKDVRMMWHRPCVKVQGTWASPPHPKLKKRQKRCPGFRAVGTLHWLPTKFPDPASVFVGFTSVAWQPPLITWSLRPIYYCIQNIHRLFHARYCTVEKGIPPISISLEASKRFHMQ